VISHNITNDLLCLVVPPPEFCHQEESSDMNGRKKFIDYVPYLKVLSLKLIKEV
jgi:hypothetical protein